MEPMRKHCLYDRHCPNLNIENTNVDVRDYFAIRILQGVIQICNPEKRAYDTEKNELYDYAIKKAYLLADKMLEVRNR